MPCFIVRNENKNSYDILERCVISVKKISVKSAALIAGAAALLTFSVTSFWAFQICSDSVATLRKKAKSIEDIYTVDQYIDEYYYGSYDEEIIVDQALKGMVSALDDKYSAYMTPDEYEQNLIDAKGSITGIGITVNKGDNNEIKIVEIAEKGPAEKAGLKINDIIIEVDGKNVNEMEYSDAVNLVRGKAGTEVNIAVKRGDEEISFKMKREEITTETVTSRMLENNIAYIKITGFKENTSHQFNIELKKCLENNASAIIFDVRNNGGGLVSACSDCLDPLLPEGDIAIAEFKDGSTEVICKSDKIELDLPMAVLVNEYSASAAELFAAALRDFGKAVLVEDPDEFIKALGAEKYQKRIDTAENSFMFEIRILEQQYDMHDPESKTKFYNAVAEKLCTFGEKLERDNYIAAVADKYMIGIEDLRRLVNQYGAKIGMAAGGAPPVRERSELRREQGSEKKKENGMIQSQKLLLTWLIEHTGLFPKIEKYISPEDFTEEIYHKAAEILYEQYRNTGTVNPAKIVSMFQNEEEQREIAGLFHATIRGVETEGDKENGGYSKETFEKALKETIVRVKQNSIEYHLKNMAPTDMAALQRSVADKKALEELEKVHISID